MAGNRWPYLLRVLLKAGWTVEGLAHAAMIEDGRVRAYLSGKMMPEHVTADVFHSILNRHKRRDGLRVVYGTDQPRDPSTPFTEFDDDLPDRLVRGVYEDPSPPEGYRQFRAIADDGTELVSLRFHWRADERDVVPGLRRWLDRADPIIRLLESDASPASF